MKKNTKTSNNKLLPLIIASTAILVLSVSVATTPSSKLAVKFSYFKQQKAVKWINTANTYQTYWNYATPSGRDDKIGFTITLSNGVIKDVKVEPFTASKDSQAYQANFGKELPKYVVGKKLSDIADLDVISGASGTTQNFKDAVAQLVIELGV